MVRWCLHAECSPNKRAGCVARGERVIWLREHKTEVAIGTVVVVAGVVAAPYVIAVMGGALVLAPL